MGTVQLKLWLNFVRKMGSTIILGSDVGDPVGHVYLRQAGTSAVRGFGNAFEYYLFPQLTAVLNPFFNGQRVLAAEVYRDERLRDRPLVNTRWELIVNDKDEPDNRDIVIGSLADIRLYITYQDFTEF